ncbi:hypothetical protein Taro_023711 [Colocasia esculenta]|uniref:Uncharacterized protein n=1 Tax=Colocasia esculenta TaxID=4460 RepID=A0A843VC96_COLES|nr:hypothetical protein [Colocasia esculenta]
MEDAPAHGEQEIQGEPTVSAPADPFQEGIAKDVSNEVEEPIISSGEKRKGVASRIPLLIRKAHHRSKKRKIHSTEAKEIGAVKVELHKMRSELGSMKQLMTNISDFAIKEVRPSGPVVKESGPSGPIAEEGQWSQWQSQLDLKYLYRLLLCPQSLLFLLLFRLQLPLLHLHLSQPHQHLNLPRSLFQNTSCQCGLDVWCVRVWSRRYGRLNLGGLIGGSHVEANLYDLQNIGLPEDSFLTPFSLSLGLFSRPLLPHYFQWLQKASWGIVERAAVMNRTRKRRSEVHLKAKEEDGEVDSNFSKVVNMDMEEVCSSRSSFSSHRQVVAEEYCSSGEGAGRYGRLNLGGLIGGSHVDANLCNLQNIGLPEDSFLTPFSLSHALFSRPLLPHYFQWLQKASWGIVEREAVTNRTRKRRSEV